MASSYPRYNYIISRTLDPIFALTIGTAAAGIRIRREENEKRAGMSTTSVVSPKEYAGQEGEIGYGEIAKVGLGRLLRRVRGEVEG